MPRKCKAEICPKCGKQGYFRSKQIGKKSKIFAFPSKKYIYFVHKNSSTGEAKECYVENKINLTFEKFAEYNPRVKKMLFLEKETQNLENELIKHINHYRVYFNECKKELTSDEMNIIYHVLKQMLDRVIKFSRYRMMIWGAVEMEIKGLKHHLSDQYLDIKLKECKIGEINRLRVREKFKKNTAEFLREWRRETKLSDPQMYRFVFLLLKYVRPMLLEKKKELSKKLSEAAFGSDLRKGLVSSSE